MNDTIAIDFGTMRTKVSYYDTTRKSIELMRLGRNEQPFVPSIFFLGQDGRRLFGEDAAQHLDKDPLAFLLNPLKRELREQAVRAGNRVKATPTELLSVLFGGLRNRAKDVACFCGTMPTGLVLTVPAQYGPPDRNVLQKAACNAGFHEERIRFVVEPVAAAQAWLAELGGTEDYVVVLDCGGGTLDWACLHRSEGGRFGLINEFPPGGDNRVGGVDIDRSILEELDGFIKEKDSQAYAYLEPRRCLIRDEIRVLKEKYSSEGIGGAVNLGNINVKILPGQIERIINDRYINQACQSFNAYLDKIRERLKIKTPIVLLAGGSARLRGFREEIEKQCRCKAVWWERSEYATVLGALQSDTPTEKGSANLPAVSRRKPLDAKAKAFIASQKQSHDDFRHFLQETFLVQWRLSNSAYGSANALVDALSTIQEGEDNKSISLKVRQGLEAVSVAPFDEIVKASSNGFVDMVSRFIEDLPSRYIQLFSGLEPFRKKFTPPDEWKAGFVREVAHDLSALKTDYETIVGYYNQLAEFYPRYDAILSRAGWLDWLIGGAVGFFTGGLGVVAAVIWGEWRGMNDQDFIQNYSAAVQSFIDACVKFNEAGERVLVTHIQRVNDVWNDAFKPLAEIYLALAEMGEDLATVERHVKALDHTAEFAGNMAAHQFAASIIANLKQQSDLSKIALQNIVAELRESGLLLTKDGDLDEKAVAALPPDEGTKLLTNLTSKVMAIIQRSPCCASDRFHVAPNIPENKLLNALKAYGYGCGAGDILALYDDSFWGGGGDGFVITLGGVLWTGPNAKGWNEIKRITKAAEGNALKLDGVSISIAMASDHVQHFVSLLKEMRDCVVAHLPADNTD